MQALDRSTEQLSSAFFPVLAMASLLAFHLLDRLYRKMHPDLYQSFLYRPEISFSFGQAIIGGLRAAVLCFTIPAAAILLLAVYVGVPVLLVSQFEGAPAQSLLFILSVVFVIGLM